MAWLSQPIWSEERAFAEICSHAGLYMQSLELYLTQYPEAATAYEAAATLYNVQCTSAGSRMLAEL